MGRGGEAMRPAFALLLLLLATTAGARELRVCADPNNLPYSNARGEGFENRIVELIAKDLGADVRYTWWAQRRGFLRNTLLANECDVVAGVASSMGMLGTTYPYYRSSYVFVSRADRRLDVHSLDDPRLKQWTIGVQLVGDDGANTPPAHALARRGAPLHVVGAAPRLPAQHPEGGNLRPGAGPACQPRRGAHDSALLPLDLCLRHTRRRAGDYFI